MSRAVIDNQEYSNPVEVVAGLRSHRSLTVNVSNLHKKSQHFTSKMITRQSYKYCTTRETSDGTLLRQEKPSCYCRETQTADQLPINIIAAPSDDKITLPDEFPYPYCHDRESDLNLLIPSRLSTPFIYISEMSLMNLRWMVTLATFTILLLSGANSVDAVTTSQAKLPLSRTDATTRSEYRIFTGAGSGATDQLLPRIAAAHSDSNRLDFQTMKVIKQWGVDTTNVLLISGRNYVYMINATNSANSGGNIHYIERLKWHSTPETKNDCQRMGKHRYECNNFIRVIELEEDGRLLVCGTNSYAPECRHYLRGDFNALGLSTSHFSSEGPCKPRCEVPFNPTTSSATLYTNTSNGFQLFSAVINDFMSQRPVLMRKDTSYVYSMEKWFNDPTFIKLVEHSDGKVYLFFRETATSVETGTDSPIVYARIAQVCKNDVGGSTVLRSQWTTFLKARLRCSSDRDEGFVFNNLTSVSEVTTINGEHGPMDVIFATFTTPWNWNTVSMSAVCAFSMETIQTLFEDGNFLEEQEAQPVNTNSDYDHSISAETVLRAVPVPENAVPHPRPGKCLNENVHMTDETLSFAKTHFLMYEPVDPLYEQTMFVSETDVRITQIAIDSNAGGNRKVLIYAGTEDGKVLRLRPRLNQRSGPKSVLLEEMQVAERSQCESGEIPCSVLALHISRPNEQVSIVDRERATPSLFVAFTDKMAQVPLNSCQDYGNSQCCSADPECGWSQSHDHCVFRATSNSADLLDINDLKLVPTDCPTPPTDRRDCSGVHLRSSVPARADSSVNDQPRSSGGCATQTHGTVDGSSEKQPGSVTDREFTDLFVERVLPSLSEEFRDTLNSLDENEEQRMALIQQLQETLIMTTNLVMRNHKQEYCLPTHSVNSLTHAYPLLLREIETWHEIALKKMKPQGFRLGCWEANKPDSLCSARVFFGVPLAPTLWEPLTRLLKDFGAKCESLGRSATDDADTAECSQAPGVGSCKDERYSNTPRCQPKQCSFEKYSVDVKAFFRHANDSRMFLPSSKGLEPLWKPTNRTITSEEAIKGHLSLAVKAGQPFVIQYSPVAEKVKITFTYAAEYDCSLNDASCAGRANGCFPKVERSVNQWFNSAMHELKPVSKLCKKQVISYHKDGRLRKRHRGIRPRRSNSNQVSLPDRCRYVRKKISQPTEELLWNHVITRAERRNGIVFDGSNRIEFFSTEDVKHFFDNECSIVERNLKHENMGRIMRKRAKIVNVAIIASRDMPFVIERKSNKVKLKFFTHLVSSFNNVE